MQPNTPQNPIAAPAQTPVRPTPIQAPAPVNAQGGVRPMAAPVPVAAPRPVPVAAPQAVPVQQAPQFAAVPQFQPNTPMPSPAAGNLSMPQVASANLDEYYVEDAREEGDRILPGISIQAFCERNETGSAINTAIRDWRMKRTNVDIFMGGLSAAVDYYYNEPTPNLIVIETGMTGNELFTQLEQLASVCDEKTKVVIVGASNDIRLYRQLIEKGVSDYLVPPLRPMAFIRSLSDLYQSEEVPFFGKSIAVYGAKGGVGTSTITHNLAWIMSETLGQETALVDLDESWGTTAIDFAYDTAQGLEEALAQHDRLDEAILDKILIRHTKKLSILPTAASLGNGSGIHEARAFETVLDGVRSMCPLSILDMPHIWSEWVSATMVAADEIVIVTTLDLASLRNTKNLVTFLKAKRPNDKDPLIVVNMVGRSKSHEIDINEFLAQIGLESSSILLFDPDIYAEAGIEGKMLNEMKGAEDYVDVLYALATRLKTGEFPQQIVKSKKKGFDVGSMLSALKKKKK